MNNINDYEKLTEINAAVNKITQIKSVSEHDKLKNISLNFDLDWADHECGCESDTETISFDIPSEWKEEFLFVLGNFLEGFRKTNYLDREKIIEKLYIEQCNIKG